MPFQVAVIVAVVVLVTALVGTLNEPVPGLPAATVTVAGGLTEGELLLMLTTAPLAGARPFNVTMADVGTPPVIGLNTVSDLSEGGWTVRLTDAEVALSVPVSVTGVAAATCPTWNWN